MTAGKFDIHIYTGISYARNIYCKQADGTTAVDLTGWNVYAQARAKLYSADVLCDLEPTISEPEEGKISIALTDEQTLELTANINGVWDLILENPAGDKIGPYLAGVFTTRQPVTR